VTSGRITVAVVDDQELFRAGMGMLLRSQDDLELVGEAADGREAVELAEAVRPDVMLMDLRMPVLDGVRATEEIVAAAEAVVGSETPRIIVLTTFRQDEAVVSALRAGASGFILKDSTRDFVLEAIRTVHAGQAVIAPPMTRELLRRFGTPVDRPRVDIEAAIGVLSPRERDVFLLVAKGLSNTEVAASSFLAETTVKTHIRSIFGKLGLRDRVQLVVFAHEKGLV
jgi:DNA-binding NarL/FixJ family response regulator